MQKNPSFKMVNLKQPAFYAIWIQTKHFNIYTRLKQNSGGKNML